jgi:hypothetical protein
MRPPPACGRPQRRRASFRRVADAPDRGELLTALTTEHFTLQGARSQTMSESSARAALFIGAVSSTLVALGFLGQLSPGGDTFNAFALGAFLDASLGVAAGAGGVVAILSVAALLRFAERLLDARTGGVDALFPSPSAGGAPSSGREQ